PATSVAVEIAPASVEQLVGDGGEEVGQLVTERDLLEDPPGLLRPPRLPGLLPHFGPDPVGVLVEDPQDESAVDHGAVLQLGAVADPLPDLAAGDLRRGGVLHQVVEADRATAA